MSISVKLIGAFLAMTIITLGLGLYAVMSLSTLGGVAMDIYDKPLMATSYARAAALDVERLATAVERYRLAPAASPEVTGAVPERIETIPEPAGPARPELTERQRLLAVARRSPVPSERRRLISASGAKKNGCRRGRSRQRASASDQIRAVSGDAERAAGSRPERA